MKQVSSVCFSLVIAAWLLCGFGSTAQAAGLRQAEVVFSSEQDPPAENAPWQLVSLPFAAPAAAAWFRVGFQPAGRPGDDLAVYLPYLYGGGRLFLDGQQIAHIQEPTPDLAVRWERPHLVKLPAAALGPGPHRLLLRIAAAPGTDVRMPLLQIGPHVPLLQVHDRRLFWVRTMSQFTVIACTVAAALALFVWWRRPEESAYGLFGAAALLWGIRTLTLVVEILPTHWWQAWRTLYHFATGGFAVVMLLFAMSVAGIRRARVQRALVAYWLLGPIVYLASGADEFLVGRVWTAGLLPVGFAILVIGTTAAWRRRTPAMLALNAAFAFAVLAGVHDYLLVSRAPFFVQLFPEVAARRLFMLHFGADILLLTMGAILSARLIGTLNAIEQLNGTLEARVAERQAALAENYRRMRELERRNAAGEERQQIMQDLHDGLGSRLFVALTRAEAHRMEQAEMAQALRECIADMRLTFEAMSSPGGNFLDAWGSLRSRWQQSLQACGVASVWELEAEEGMMELTPHTILQLLRIVQEALTNILKHAHASRVLVQLRADPVSLSITVLDDGRGFAQTTSRGERGIANMRARAGRLGAHLEITEQHPGLRVSVHLPGNAVA